MKAGGQSNGFGAQRRVSQSRWRLRFKAQSQGDLQCGDDAEHQGESSSSHKAPARAQAVVQCSDSCVTGARRADVCVGGQMQTAAAPFRAHPAAPLRDEIDGIHLDQCEAFLSCLKLATSYMEYAGPVAWFTAPCVGLRAPLHC